MLSSLILVFHVCAGISGLVSGVAAMSFRKGSRRHAAAGTAFAIAMLSMSATGAYIGLMKSQTTNVVMGILTFYLVATGWRTARHKDGQSGIFDWLALALALAFGTGLVIFGIEAAYSQAGLKNGYPAAFYFIFGSVALLSAAGDIRMLVRGGVYGKQRIARHLWRMCFGLFIAAGSFFLGQQKVFPVSLQGSKILFAPPVLALLLMIFWLIRVRLTNAFGRPLEAPTAPAILPRAANGIS
jgi:uncharacterized membrane protein